jgi:hypothetical protein
MRKLVLLSAGAVLGLGLVGVAPAQNGEPARNGEKDTWALVHVGLNPGDCTGPSRGPFVGAHNGVVDVHFNAVQRQFKVNVSVHDALPKTTYAVNTRCVGQIGSLTTNSQGTGTAQIDVSQSAPPAGLFYIDISVRGGGGGSGGYGDTFIAGPFSLQ